MISSKQISPVELANIQSQVETAPVIYSLSLANAKELVLTGSFQSKHGLDTEPLSLEELVPLVESMMTGMPIGRNCAFYYRNESSAPMMLLARKVVGDIEMCPMSVNDPQLLNLLGITKQ